MTDRTDGQATTAGYTAKGPGGIMLAVSVSGDLIPEGRVGPMGGFMGTGIAARNLAAFAAVVA